MVPINAIHKQKKSAKNRLTHSDNVIIRGARAQ
jgi:hypothetical protein